ncbi:YhdP family protein [Rugamonas brunnea]|uniref:YhdP family protein n=1 Tax=Rugamonas brunnea TaxID=2758569 RepID=UPI0028830217|nr:YhdP family protein [Rugamonas brunnea]
MTGNVPLAVRWQRLRAVYRVCNLASHHVLGFAIKSVALLYFVFGVLFLVLRYAILPNIDHYKPDIERLASRAVGNQVTIARLYASWNGLHPNLFLGDVLLRDAQGRQVLALPSVSATLSWWSVLAADVRFESLELIRPDLDARRLPDGTLVVAGVHIDLNQGGDGRAADWLLGQREIVVREGRIVWTDQLRAAPPLALDQLTLVLRNQWRRHQFALKATPPAALSAPLDVRADFTHPPFTSRVSNVAMWTGQLYAQLRDADLAAWNTYLTYPFTVQAGQGSLRAWVDLDHAKLAGFMADVRLANVAAVLGKDLPPLDLVQVQGRLAAREEYPAGDKEGKPTFGARGHTVELSNFSLTTRDGLTLAPTSLFEHHLAASGKQPEKTELRAPLLDLQTLASLAGRLPLTPRQRKMLADFAPHGRLLDVVAEWQGAYPALQTYRVRGRLDGLGLNPLPAQPPQPKTARSPAIAGMPAIPGFDNLSGSIDATEKGGTLSLDTQQLVLQMPAYFTEPSMPFERLAMRARWSFEKDDKLRVQVDSLDFAQQGLTASLSGSHVLPLAGKGLGQVDFTGKLNGFALNTIDRYLPLQTPHDLRAWLTGALEDGMAQDVTLRLRGDLAQFPFRTDTAAERARGEFRVAGRLENARLNYTPGETLRDEGKLPLWPQAEKIKGSFVFEGPRMEIRGDTARTGGAALSNVKAVIPDLTVHDMMLDIDGTATGPMQEFLKYVTVSPVQEWINHFTDETQSSGNTKLALKLHLPLNHLIDAKVLGVLQLQGNDVTLFNDLPPVLGSQGKIEFNERGVNLNGLGGSFLGGPVSISGGTQRDNAIVVKLAGTVTADGFRRNYPAPAMQRLASHFAGATRFGGQVTVRDHQLQVAVDTSLVGAGLDLPAPLKKAAPEALPLRFVMNSNLNPEGGAWRDDIRIGIGNAIAARYQRQKTGKGPWRLVRGGVGVNAPAPEPDSGVAFNLNMRALNVDAWLDLASAMSSAPAAVPAPARQAAEEEGMDVAQFVQPDAIVVRAGELLVGDRKLENVLLGLSHQKNVWQANIDSSQANGYLTWAEAPGGLGKVTARLSTLIIPESAAGDVRDLLEGKNSTATIPALDIMAERFELFNKPLGKLELLANNVMLSTGREWRVSKLLLANPDGELKGTGRWISKDGVQSSSLNFGLELMDAGKLLDRFGFAGTLRGGKGTLSGDIAWKGLPYAFDIPSLSGQITMNVEKGQFLKQDPGAAKLLGVLSLQALPRLLKLDFHDVFSEGLAFDGITANAAIDHGIVKTENLKMHGVAATVLMDGTADIANESTNLHVVVIPQVNLGTAPLVYALAVNPVIGLGSFLAQLFLSAPVMKALTYQMQVTGPWKAPVVTKLASAQPDSPAPAAVPAQ